MTDTTNKEPDGNEPAALHWTISAASREFGMARETLRKKLVGAGEHATDGTFTTRQIAAAVFGDKEAAAIRLKDAQAESAEIENARARKELIRVEDAAVLNRRIATSIRQIILKLPLSKEQRHGLLAEIQRLAEVDFTRAEGLDDDDAEPSA